VEPFLRELVAGLTAAEAKKEVSDSSSSVGMTADAGAKQMTDGAAAK
jgi:hypothetical protein